MRTDPPSYDPNATWRPPLAEKAVDDRAETMVRVPGSPRREIPSPVPSAEGRRSRVEARQGLARAVDRLSTAVRECDGVAEAVRDEKDVLLMYERAILAMPAESQVSWRLNLVKAERGMREAQESVDAAVVAAGALERAQSLLSRSARVPINDAGFVVELASAAERAEGEAARARGRAEVACRLLANASGALRLLENDLQISLASEIDRVGPTAFMRQRADPALVGLRAQAVEAWRVRHPEQVVKVPRQAPVAKPVEQLPSVMIAPEAMPQAAREYFRAHPELEAMRPPRPPAAERVRPQDRLPSVMIKSELGPTTPQAERERLFAQAKERLAQVRDAVVDSKGSADLLERAAPDAGNPEAQAIYQSLRAAHDHLLERLDFSVRTLAAAEAGTLKLDDAPIEAQLKSFVRGLDEIRQEQLVLDREMHTHEGLIRRAYVEKVRREGEAKFIEESQTLENLHLRGLRVQAVEDYRKQEAEERARATAKEAAKPLARLQSAANRVRGWFRRS